MSTSYRKIRSRGSKLQQSTNKNENIDETEESDTSMVVIPKALLITEDASVSLKWMLDNACTSHMTNDRNNFTTFCASNKNVQVVKGEFMKTEGMEIVKATSIEEGKKVNITFHEEFYVPNILYNLLSICKIRKGGFRTIIEDGDKLGRTEIQRVAEKSTSKIRLREVETIMG